jgi:general secretion pathway protein I
MNVNQAVGLAHCATHSVPRPQKSVRSRPSPGRLASDRPGLTLFEVLLALVIFVAALSAIGQLLSSGIRGALHSRFQLQAAQMCQAKMGEIVCGAQPMNTAHGVDPNDKDWSWNLQVMPSPVQGLMKVQVTVQRMSRSKPAEFSFSMTRYVKDPAVYIAAEEEAARIAEETEEASQ